MLMLLLPNVRTERTKKSLATLEKMNGIMRWNGKDWCKIAMKIIIPNLDLKSSATTFFGLQLYRAGKRGGREHEYDFLKPISSLERWKNGSEKRRRKRHNCLRKTVSSTHTIFHPFHSGPCMLISNRNKITNIIFSMQKTKAKSKTKQSSRSRRYTNGTSYSSRNAGWMRENKN